MTDQPNPTGTPAEPTAELASKPGAGASGNQPDFKALYEAAQAESENWKKRFTGLQGTYQREQQKWTAESAKVQDLEQLIRGFDDERTALKGEIEKLTGAQQELRSLKTLHERLGIIATEFPDLLDFERDGLLPGDTGEELRIKLSALRTRLTQQGKQAIEQKLGGAVPPAPKGEPPSTPAQLLQAAVNAMREGKMDEYNRLYSEYLAQSKEK